MKTALILLITMIGSSCSVMSDYSGQKAQAEMEFHRAAAAMMGGGFGRAANPYMK